MNIGEMTIQEFRKIPWRENWAGEIECDWLIILPAQRDLWGEIRYHIQSFFASIFSFVRKPEIWEIEHLHDSGYRCMDFVAVKDGEPLCRLSGCSDVVHIDGIGGYGYRWSRKPGVPRKIDIHGWSIDCLPASGLLRIWPDSNRIICGSGLSSFEIYAIPKESADD